MSKSRQDIVKGVVGKAEAETEMERDAVVSGAELGLWYAEMQPTVDAGPPSAGSWTPTACKSCTRKRVARSEPSLAFDMLKTYQEDVRRRGCLSHDVGSYLIRYSFPTP
jgi:hypothetical protein